MTFTVVTTHHGRSAAEIDASSREEMDKLLGTIAEIKKSVSQGNELVAQRKANDKTKNYPKAYDQPKGE